MRGNFMKLRGSIRGIWSGFRVGIAVTLFGGGILGRLDNPVIQSFKLVVT